MNTLHYKSRHLHGDQSLPQEEGETISMTRRWIIGQWAEEGNVPVYADRNCSRTSPNLRFDTDPTVTR